MTTSRQTTVAARDLARRIGRRAAVQLVLLCAVTAAVIGVTSMSSSSASASEVSGSWEAGGYAPFSALECPHPSSQFQLVTSPTREGSHAARFNITGADVWSGNGTVRCLAAKYDTGETTGMDSYFHVSVYIPSPGISSNLIWELHHPSELYNLSKCGVAPFAITTDGKGLEFRIATGDCKVGQGWSNWESGIKIPGLDPYPTDTWIDVVVHIRVSEASDGLVEVWGRSANNPWPASPQLTRQNIPTMPYASSQGVHNVKLYTEMGLYPGYSGYNGNDTIYLDDYRREATLASAQGSSGSGGTPAAAPAPAAPAPAPTPAPAPKAATAATPKAAADSGKAAFTPATAVTLETKAYAIEWDNRLFSTVGVFRSYLLGLGVDWSSFIKKHPAVVTQTGLPFIKWDGKQIYDQASLTRVLSRDGVSYRRWAGKHPRAATLLAGRPVATAQRTTARVVQKKVAITWAGIGFTNADGLRAYIVRQKLDWNAFLVGHPAAAKRLGLATLTWDGSRFYSREALSRWLVKHHGTLARWSKEHPGIVDKLMP